MDRGVVSPGLSGATTTAWEPWFSGNPARWDGPGPLSASRLGGGVAEGREHMISISGSCELASVQGAGVAGWGGVAESLSGLSFGGGEWHVCLARRGAICVPQT